MVSFLAIGFLLAATHMSDIKLSLNGFFVRDYGIPLTPRIPEFQMPLAGAVHHIAIFLRVAVLLMVNLWRVICGDTITPSNLF